jgi:hypothetical protein
VSKKKTVARTSPPLGELPLPAESLPASVLPANGPPLPSTDPGPALLNETASPVDSSSTLGGALAIPVASEPTSTDSSSPLLEPSRQLAPAGPAPDDPPPPIFDLALAPSVAQPVALAVPAPEPALATLVERVERLEEALKQVQNLQGIEQRVAERVVTQPKREKPAPAESGSPVLAKAAALLDAGKHLIPSLVRQDAPPAPAPPPPQAHPESHRMWLLWEAIAEARAIVRMYVDPRWSLSWMGRTVPPLLLVAFLLIHYWMPFAIVPIVGPIVEKAGELVIGFLLFKVLGHEARRYRATAPDLPPSLRL